MKHVDIRYDQSNENYHKKEFEPTGKKTYFSSSQLKKAQESLLSFQHALMGWTPAISTQALKFGNRHHDIREAGGFDEWEHRVEVVPAELERKDGTLRSCKEVREFYDTFQNKEILTRSEYEKHKKMDEMLMANHAARRLEEDAESREVSIRIREDGMKFGSKVRYDMRTKGGILVDYKTTSEPDPRRTFHKAVRKYNYGLSSVLYTDVCRFAGIDVSEMHFVVSSTVAPEYETQVIVLSQDYLEYCRHELGNTKDLIAYTWDKLCSGEFIEPEGYGLVHEMEIFH